jgi:hypothetical protein
MLASETKEQEILPKLLGKDQYRLTIRTITRLARTVLVSNISAAHCSESVI